MKKLVCVLTAFAIVAAGWIIYERNNDKNDGVYPGMYIEYTSEGGEVDQKALYVCGVDWQDDLGHYEQIDVHLDRGPVTKNVCMDVSQSICFKFISYEPDKMLLLEVERNSIDNFNEKDLAKAKEVDVDESFTCKQNCAYIMICYKENNWVAYSFSTFSDSKQKQVNS